MMHRNLNDFSAICRSEGFLKKGRAFFRVFDGGVLQVLKFSAYSSPWKSEEVDLGLFSLYGELQPQWLTAWGCIPYYNSLFLKEPRWEVEKAYYSANVKTYALCNGVLYYQYDRVNIVQNVIPFLNSVNSQKRMIEGLNYLEYIESNIKPKNEEASIRWTDVLRFAPYLYSGDREKAAMVILALLALHKPEYSNSEEVKLLKEKLHLAQNGSHEQIETYLRNNYLRNQAMLKGIRRGQGDGSKTQRQTNY